MAYYLLEYAVTDDYVFDVRRFGRSTSRSLGKRIAVGI
jgi:hypothetical protein